MANYSYEKGKHGGTTGMIFPYFRTINGLLPLDQDYRDFIPAGFLRCRGQILQADQFPALAELLGVGASSTYKREGAVLQERSENGTGGTFQLPDLGSKFITTSSNPGSYLNDTTIDRSTNTSVSRAGIAVTITAGQEEIEFPYDGSFRAPAVTLSFTGNWRPVSPPPETSPTSLSIANFVAHAHVGSFAIGARVNTNGRGYRAGSDRWAGPSGFNICFQSGGGACGGYNTGNPQLRHRNLSFQDAGVDSDHSHALGAPIVNASGPFSTIPAVNIAAQGITTTVRLRTRDVSKLDNVTPKFIICEYLIKF
jgi:hypothetical protein